jgi:hypothetical protein
LITRIVLVEEYRSLSSSLCSVIHSLVTCFLLGPNTSILPSPLFRENAQSVLHKRALHCVNCVKHINT